MGYSYGRNAANRMALVCDGCGKVGGVRKRACKYTVLTDNLRSTTRQRIRYCYPPALCATCYAQRGGLNGVHGEECRNGAAESQADYDATQARLNAGELHVISASGDWAEGVPAGHVRVTFAGAFGRNRVQVIMPESEYDSSGKPWLSQYPAYA